MTRSLSTDAPPRQIEEVLASGIELPLWSNSEWAGRFPWLLQGTTGRGTAEDGGRYDFGLFGETPTGRVMERWRALRHATGMETVVHSRQVHGARLHAWTSPPPSGIVIIDGYDAHSTERQGLLLTISIADCVPVFLVAERARAIVLAHAGWRGVAGGVVEAAIGSLVATAGVTPGELWLHCGPSICGNCYEVGPEVHEAVDGTGARHARPEPIDLKQSIARRAVASGLDPERISVSTHCTRCGPPEFYSHRGGSAGRQLGILGVRREG